MWQKIGKVTLTPRIQSAPSDVPVLTFANSILSHEKRGACNNRLRNSEALLLKLMVGVHAPGMSL
ncbi:hypothetical protein V22_20150 [Calycomorphotria hydatis]|uniref:Uncharacterized protein n=1 Tax=Calycomorphotria hydatis TaxID=2528027 RepID=A0A517T8S0_9PLAN|nr:hypothetical protein V22_20150 [Calycomorphotria hydatis]